MTRLEFNNHVLQLSRRLYLVAFRFLKSREEAEDAVQEVFIRLWNKREKLDEYFSIEALAITTIKNYCIDQIRKSKPIMLEDQNKSFPVYINEPLPDEIMERAESSQIISGVIDRLPELYRNLITMKEIDGLSYEEIAALTDQNINTLRVNLSRARKMIRDEFKKIKYEYTGNSQTTRKIL
jgi:RNA polymerase sigma factor (sigma-70 family)